MILITLDWVFQLYVSSKDSVANLAGHTRHIYDDIASKLRNVPEANFPKGQVLGDLLHMT